MEEFVADQDNRGEKTQLKVVQSCWCLGLISADDEQWKEDGEQGATNDVGGGQGCQESHGQTKTKVIRPIPLNIGQPLVHFNTMVEPAILKAVQRVQQRHVEEATHLPNDIDGEQADDHPLN